MSDLRPYDSYRDSGVPWLGPVPAHWQRALGGAVLQPKCVKNRGMIESTVLSLSYGRIVVKPPEKLHGLVPESFETYQIVDPGDIIIRPTDLQNDWNTIRVGLAHDRGIITSAYICFHARPPLTPEYAHLLLLGYDFKKVFYGMGSGLRQNLDWSDFRRLPILIPPPDEQQAIVRSIRDVDSRINRFIRNRRRLIEVLNEQKQAIIHRAVTRGLDDSAPLKPSGIDWLGKIPEHWEVKRLKWVTRLQRGYDLPQQERLPGSYPVISSGGIIDRHNDFRAKAPGVVMGRQTRSSSSMRTTGRTTHRCLSRTTKETTLSGYTTCCGRSRRRIIPASQRFPGLIVKTCSISSSRIRRLRSSGRSWTQ